MNQLNMRVISELKKYSDMSVKTDIQDASPHRLIQMLLEGAISRILKAKTCINNNDTQKKGEFISMAISIIGGLRDSLDHKAGADLAMNLDNLYEYMSGRLLEANVKNDISMLDEVYGLLMEIKTAWDSIGQPPLPRPPISAENVGMLRKQAV